jgi:acyl carrier protein
MIPSSYVFLSALPLTDNGKIDRKALHGFPPSILQEDAPKSDPQKVPQTDLERIVSEAWKEALGLPSVGLDQNFFDLGAHSLTVAEVQAKLQNLLQRDISIVDLFEFSTIASLSRHLSAPESALAGTLAKDRAQRRKLARQR